MVQSTTNLQELWVETVRFAKLTLDLKEVNLVLELKRLLGFAAVEKRDKGPTLMTSWRVRAISSTDLVLVASWVLFRWSELLFVSLIDSGMEV